MTPAPAGGWPRWSPRGDGLSPPASEGSCEPAPPPSPPAPGGEGGVLGDVDSGQEFKTSVKTMYTFCDIFCDDSYRD